MNKFLYIICCLLMLTSCGGGSASSEETSSGSIEEARAFYDEMELILGKYPHRAKLYLKQCEDAEDILSYYHSKGDVLDIPVLDFEYLSVFTEDTKPNNSFYLSQWRGCRSKSVNRLFPKYKFLEEGEWGNTVSVWEEMKENKYVIVCSPLKRMGPELLGNQKYKRGYYKGHYGIYNLESKEVECYGEFSILNKYNTPEQLNALNANMEKALWIDLSMMFDYKLKEAIEKGTGIPAKNIKLNLETL